MALDASSTGFAGRDAPFAFFVTAADTTILTLNPTLAEWLGRAPAELVGMRLTDLLSPSGRVKYESVVVPMVSLRSVAESVILDLPRDDGTLLHLLCSCSIAEEDAGRPLRWFGLNVTGRRTFELDLVASQRRLGRLQSLSRALSTVMSAEEIASAVLREVVDGIKAHTGVFARIEPTGSFTVLSGASDGERPPPEEGLLDTAILQSLLSDGLAWFGPREPSPSAEGPVAQMAVLPLRSGPELHGMLVLELERADGYTMEERQLLVAVADISAQALGRMQLLEQVRQDGERNYALSVLLHGLEEINTVAGRAQRIADFLVPDMADFATIELLGWYEPTGLKHCDPELEATLRELRSAVNIEPDQPHSLAEGREQGKAQLLSEVGDELYQAYGLDDRLLSLLKALAPRSYLGLPLIARGEVIGSMMMVNSVSARRFVQNDVEFYERLAYSCALALENARLYEVAHDQTIQLQRALLPLRLPKDARVRLSGFYEAGHSVAQIGGDWYDAFRIGPDRLGLVVGDIVGGGLDAATAMADLRVALRAYALEAKGVAVTLTRLNRYAMTVDRAFASSVFYAELDLAARTMTYGSAGHPPPVLVHPDRHAEVLWDGRGCLLAISSTDHVEATVEVPPGSTVVLYTDGLIERRGRSVDLGLTELVKALESDAVPSNPAWLAKRLSSADHGDDTCILTISLTPESKPPLVSSAPGRGDANP